MCREEETQIIDLFEELYRNYYRNEIGELAQNYPTDQKSLHIDWQEVYRFDPDLADDLRNHPDQFLSYAHEALRLFDLPVDVKLGNANVRVTNLPCSTPIQNIRSQHRGKLIKVEGTVRSVSSTISRPTTTAFECQRCGTLTRIPQQLMINEDVQKPTECQGCERQGPFRINEDQSEIVDAQKLRIEEPRETRIGENPGSIIVLVKEDLVDTAAPGERVQVTGVLRLTGLEGNAQALDATVTDKYLAATGIEKSSGYFSIDISDEDKREIIALSEQNDIYEEIVDSIAPYVYDSEELKLALAFQLFSGVPKNLPDGSAVRGSIHIAALGDPGTKSDDLADFVERLAPHGIGVNGNHVTKPGLTTAAYTSKSSRKNWELDAGALVLADNGVACVTKADELDPEAQAALESVMREQRVAASKGTSTEKLPARCSVFASGHPKYGRFDQYEPIAEQIDLYPSLISQFDLIFTVTDEPDTEQDKEHADHILSANYAGEVLAQKNNSPVSDASSERADEATEEIKPEISPDLLRKYIAYARRNVYPTLSKEANKKIKTFYAEIRSQGTDSDVPVPASINKLEAIIRLTEASARIRLSDTVEKEDAERVIELVRSTIEDLGLDPETGELDDELTEDDVSEAQRKRIMNLKTVIVDLEKKFDKGAPIEKVLERAVEAGMERSRAEHEIEKLKQKGETYEPVNDHLRST